MRCPLLLCSSLVSLLFLLFFFSCGCDFFSHYFISRFFFLASLSERDHTQTKIHAKKKLLLSKRHKNKKRSLCLSIRARAGARAGNASFRVRRRGRRNLSQSLFSKHHSHRVYFIKVAPFFFEFSPLENKLTG